MPPEAISPLATGKESTPLTSARVLLVEDDPDQRDSMAKLLSHAGIAVVAVGSVKEAIASLKDAIFDLLILDIVLQDGRGWDFLSHVRSLDTPMRSVRALAVSGYNSRQNQDKVREAGFDAYLLKPVKFPHLMGIIAGLLGRGGSSV